MGSNGERFHVSKELGKIPLDLECGLAFLNSFNMQGVNLEQQQTMRC